LTENASKEVKEIIQNLMNDFRRISVVLDDRRTDGQHSLKLMELKMKVAAQLHHFIRLRGEKASDDDLLKLLEKLPEKHVKKARKWVIINAE